MPSTGPQARTRPRDARATSELILTAATSEFARHGYAGARIDRIADAAGANKRLIYVYFGDKDRLYAAVLDRQLERLVTNVPFVAADMPGFAAGRFDYVLAHPEVGRLAAWRTFEPAAEATENEIQSYQERVAAVAAAQSAGSVDDAIPAVDLFALVLRMTQAWLSAPPALRAVTGDPDSDARLAQHRQALVEAVRRLTTRP
jgi:AcrR family transcriptional regulator